MRKLKLFSLLCLLLVGVGHVWADPTNVSISFGTGNWVANSNASYEDSDSRTWSRTFSAGNKSSGGTGYAQFGNSNNACTSLVFTATAGSAMTVTAFSATLEGASAQTAGTIYLYKRSGTTDNELAQISLSGTTSTTCSITSSVSFASTDVFKVAYVGTTKAVKITNISYTYTTGGGASNPTVFAVHPLRPFNSLIHNSKSP